ncbi:MAG: hypothetical protein ACYCTV_01235 [Leptospirales bacterium]
MGNDIANPHGEKSQSSWSTALSSISAQIKLMLVSLVVILVFFTFWGKAHLKDHSFQQKIVESHHLLKIGSYSTFQDALTHLSERVSGAIKTYPYQPGITVWYANLTLFGVAFPDQKGVIRQSTGKYELYEED